jgi:CheY-like chemotaxis protein
LAISKQLVELMGGRMEVESELERGSTFRFLLELPIHEPAPGEEVALPDLKRMRVLAVDDHPVNLEMLKDIFEAWGVPHAEVPSGQGALKALRQAVREQRPFDVVLLDYHMPGMDGLFLAAAIRAEPEISNVQLILFSSSSFNDDQQRKMAEAGITAHLFKPLRQFELRQVLCQVSTHRPLAADPASPPKPSPALAPQPAPGLQALAGLRVLLAEDNEVNREVALEMLQSLGCTVDCAPNGLEAVALARRQRYPLIFMDCQMPEMDGFEAAKTIRQFETPPAAIIIAMTARAMAGDRDQCLEAGMNDHLAKPVTFAEVRLRLLHYAQQLGARAPLNPATASGAASSPPPGQAPERSAPGPAAAWPLFDVEAGLAVTGGRRETLRKAIKIWWRKVPEWLTDLKLGIQRGDAPAIGQTAHTLRGAAGSIGAIAIQHRAEAIETQATPDSLASLANLFDQLVTDIERLRQMTSPFEEDAATAQVNETAISPDR